MATTKQPSPREKSPEKTEEQRRRDLANKLGIKQGEVNIEESNATYSQRIPTKHKEKKKPNFMI